jgi:glucose/mannose transport system permease protein
MADMSAGPSPLAPAGYASVKRRKNGVGHYVVVVLLLLASLFYLMPVYVMVINGLKDKDYVSFATMWSLPHNLSGGGFGDAWRRLSPNLGNSFKMVIPATIISGMFGAVNGYIFSKWRFRGSDLIFTLVLFGMFIPYQSILIPLIRALSWITNLTGIPLYGSIWGLTLVHIVYGLPICSLIFRNYFSNVPNELIEAARIDGAGVVGIFRQIILPLSAPAFVVVGIFQFTNIWNDFLFGVTIVSSPAAQPITVALNNLSGSFDVDWNVVMAGAVVAALPTLVVYTLLGRFFIRGLLAGSMKG